MKRNLIPSMVDAFRLNLRERSELSRACVEEMALLMDISLQLNVQMIVFSKDRVEMSILRTEKELADWIRSQSEEEKSQLIWRLALNVAEGTTNISSTSLGVIAKPLKRMRADYAWMNDFSQFERRRLLEFSRLINLEPRSGDVIRGVIYELIVLGAKALCSKALKSSVPEEFMDWMIDNVGISTIDLFMRMVMEAFPGFETELSESMIYSERYLGYEVKRHLSDRSKARYGASFWTGCRDLMEFLEGVNVNDVRVFGDCFDDPPDVR